MTRDQLLGLIRDLITAVGAFFIGHAIFKIPITSELIDTIVGIVLAAFGIVWGIKDKTLKEEQWQSGMMKVLIGVGGILVAAGTIKSTDLDKWLGLAAVLLPVIFNQITKVKNQQIKRNPETAYKLRGTK
jgi:hypothetical protein